MKHTFLLLSINALVLLGACTSSSTPKTEAKKTASFPITSPVVLDTTFVQEYVADIQAIQNVEVRARVKGFLDRIHVDEGQTVQAGQLLFSLSSQEFTAEILKANAQLKSAEADAKIAQVELKNAQSLFDKKIVSSAEVEMAKAKLDAWQARIEEAQSTIATARLNLSFTEVRAPFSGVINRLPLKRGSLIEEGALLTTISNNDEVFAYFHLSESNYLQMMRDKENIKEASLLMADGQLFDDKGFVETAESEINKNTGNLAFRARFTNKDRLLKHGASGKILLPKKLTKAMVIPQKSTFEVQENTYVYVVGKDGKVQLRSVEILQRLPQLYVVGKGLTTEDQILFEGIQQVKEGDQIKPETRNPKTVLTQLAKS